MHNPSAPEAGYHETRTEVRYVDTDQMGYAHHSCYVAWFEMGRIAWMRDRGLPYRGLEARGLLMPVVRLELKYLQPGRFEDQLAVQTRLVEMGRASVVFENRVCRVAPGAHGPAVLAEGRVELACVDNTGRVQRLPEDVRRCFETRDASA